MDFPSSNFSQNNTLDENTATLHITGLDLEEQKRTAQSFELEHRKTTTVIVGLPVDRVEIILNHFLMR